MDIVVVRGVDEPHPVSLSWNLSSPKLPARGWFEASLYTVTATLITLLMERVGFSEVNLVMVYLLAVVATAARCGSLPSIVVSVASF